MKVSRAPQFLAAALWTSGSLCIFLCWVVTQKYHHFGYGGSDLGLYAQMMWDLAHADVSPSLFGGNFLIDHATYIAFLLAPLFLIFPAVLTLLYLKVLAFFSGALVLFLIAQKRLPPVFAFLFMLGYTCYPPNVGMLLFEFNFENLALPLIFLAFYFYDEKKYLPFIATGLLLASVKENMPLVLSAFGALGAFRYRDAKVDLIRWAVIPLILGVALFWLEIFVIHPALINGYPLHGNRYWTQYKTIGGTPSGILKTAVFAPMKILEAGFSLKKSTGLAELFGPLILPALASPASLLLGTTVFLQNILSGSANQLSIFFYYTSTMTPFIFLSALESLGRWKKNARLLILVLAGVFIFSACYIPEWNKRTFLNNDPINDIRHGLLAQIDTTAPVAASVNFLPFLAERRGLYILGRTYNTFTHMPEQLPDNVAFAAIDFSTFIDNKTAVKRFMLDRYWSVDTAIEDVVLLHKTPGKGHPLLETFPASEEDTSASGVLSNPALVLHIMNIPSVISSRANVLPITYDWNILEDLPGDGRVSITLLNHGEARWTKTRYMAYGLPLKKDERIRETYNYRIPRLAAGTYEIVLDVIVKVNPEKYYWSGPVRRTIQVR